uniref:Uncharacterized protein n=1 Tax=Knipowitschia caucasica TaxID=637954 RepID=A0AAV2KW98_KNICA
MFSSAKGTACDMDAISPMRRRHCRHVTLAPSLNCERQLLKDISLACDSGRNLQQEYCPVFGMHLSDHQRGH